jgi:cytoskeletal protein CcmA (bactofilin family)
MRRRLFAFTLFLLVYSVSVASARQILQADQCMVPTDESIKGNLFVTCRTLTIEGTVEGDVIGAAATSSIMGTIEGSIYLLGGQLDVFGTIAGDLHFAGPVLHIHSGANLLYGDVFSFTLSTESEETIAGNVVAAGYELVLEGDVGREVSFWGTALTIAGEVRGDVDASVGDPQSTGVAELRALLTPAGVALTNPGLYITDQGMVNGQLTYTGPVEGEILAELPHEPVFQQVITQTDLTTLTEGDNFAHNVGVYFSVVLYDFITLSLIGIIALLVAPRALQAPIPTLRMRPLPSLGVGLIAFILSWAVILVILLLSAAVVGLFLLLQLRDLTLISALLLAVLDFSGIGLYAVIAVFITRVIVALALGRFIVRRLFGNDTSRGALIFSLLLGIVILALFASLPLVGWLINAMALFLGLGAILTLLQEELEKARAAPMTVPTDSVEARQVPPPMVDDRPSEPGRENLPEGFKWWQ